MYLEVQAGRGRIDLLIIHKQPKYIVETKIWEGERCHRAGKEQLLAYLKLEQATEGYYVVFDHRQNTTPRIEQRHLTEYRFGVMSFLSCRNSLQRLAVSRSTVRYREKREARFDEV